MSFLGDLFGGGAERRAADANRALADTYQTKGTDYINSGYNTARGDLNNALSAYTPLSDLAKKYGAGTGLYLDALGANGPTGNSRATAAFQSGPGYDFTLNSGIDALNRRRAAAGMLDSGNSDLDAIKFGTGLADQTYGDWLTRLGGLVNPELSATSGAATGQAGVYGGLGTLATNNASDLTNLLGSATSANMSANNLQAQGEAAGAKNLLGLGSAFLGLGTGGGGTVGGSLLSGLGRLF
jgi:hypothetical protein